jgi:Tol biopolymer transport system component
MSKKIALAVCATALAVPTGVLSTSGSRTFDHAYGARWSPTGNRVAFVAFGNGRNPALEVATAAGTRRVKLTSNWYVAQAPAWSPRGRRLAFVRITNVSRETETSSLWTIEIGTRVKKRVALSTARFDLNSDPAWSPSGSRIAFTLLDEPPNSVANYRIYTIKGTGRGRRFLAQGQRPDWSPDGKKIVFDRTPRLSSTTEVWAVNADGTGARLLAAPAVQPEFAPDGRRIAFQRNGDIWSMNADGSGQQRLTDASEAEFAPRWSPDGRRIAFLRGRQLYVMNADGSREAQIAPSSAFGLVPDRSPNGKTIVYTRCTSSTLRSCRVAFANVGTST